MSLAYFIGIDGGGTGCRARLRGADGALLGEGQGGPGNIRLGLDQVWGNLNAAIDGALAAAGLGRDIFARTSIGLGLAGIVDEASAAATIAAGPSFARASAVSDAHIACLGAFAGGDGAILIAGTGSAAYALIDGKGIAMFGWGFEVDDKGSAASLGRSAITAALDGHDGLGPDTDFTRAVRRALGDAPGAMVDWITAARPRDYGSIAPMVMTFAQSGDAVAVELIRRSAAEVEAMMTRLCELGADRICLVGGMAEHLEPWLSPWAHGVLAPRAHDAADGAILLAGGTIAAEPSFTA